MGKKGLSVSQSRSHMTYANHFVEDDAASNLRLPHTSLILLNTTLLAPFAHPHPAITRNTIVEQQTRVQGIIL